MTKVADIVSAYEAAKGSGIEVRPYVSERDVHLLFNGFEVRTVGQMNAFVNGFCSGKELASTPDNTNP